MARTPHTVPSAPATTPCCCPVRGRNYAAVDAARFLRIPPDHVDRARHLGERLGKRFALFERQETGDLLAALLHALRGGEQRFAALERRNAFPDLEAALGGRDRIVDVVCARKAERAARFAGGG